MAKLHSFVRLFRTTHPRFAFFSFLFSNQKQVELLARWGGLGSSEPLGDLFEQILSQPLTAVPTPPTLANDGSIRDFVLGMTAIGV